MNIETPIRHKHDDIMQVLEIAGLDATLVYEGPIEGCPDCMEKDLAAAA